jgi:diguanylate cyclase
VSKRKLRIRTTDIVARYRGKEFTVLLTNKGKQKAIEIAEKIGETIKKRIFTFSQHGNITVTTSIGIYSLYTNNHEGDVNEIATLFVERALYQAENNGRNRIKFYTGDE